MLLNQASSKQYVEEFERKFKNFCEKSPALLSFTTTPQGVQVVDEHADKVYDIDWEFSVPVKSFIFGIKQILIDKGCYPILFKKESNEVVLTQEEQVELASQGTNLDALPTTKTIDVVRKFLIDKTIIFRDFFILKELESDKTYRYHLKTSAVFFLKKIRSGKLDRFQAGEYFFTHADLLNEIIPRGSEGHLEE